MSRHASSLMLTSPKGKVIKKTFNPTFNERVSHAHYRDSGAVIYFHFQFAYKVSEEELPKRSLQLVVFASSAALVTKKTCVATVTSPPSVGCLAGTTCRSLLGPDSCWSPDLPASCRRRPLSFYLFMFVCVCVCVDLIVCSYVCIYVVMTICCPDICCPDMNICTCENSAEVGRG